MLYCCRSIQEYSSWRLLANQFSQKLSAVSHPSEDSLSGCCPFTIFLGSCCCQTAASDDSNDQTEVIVGVWLNGLLMCRRTNHTIYLEQCICIKIIFKSSALCPSLFCPKQSFILLSMRDEPESPACRSLFLIIDTGFSTSCYWPQTSPESSIPAHQSGLRLICQPLQRDKTLFLDQWWRALRGGEN